MGVPAHPAAGWRRRSRVRRASGVPCCFCPLLTLTVRCEGGGADPDRGSTCLGNLSRAGFGWREIRWRPAPCCSAPGRCRPACIGSRLFVALPPGADLAADRRDSCCIVVAAAAHDGLAGGSAGLKPLLAPAGAVVGLRFGGRRQCRGRWRAAAFLGSAPAGRCVRGELRR